jgi:hypothetical protein
MFLCKEHRVLYIIGIFLNLDLHDFCEGREQQGAPE